MTKSDVFEKVVAKWCNEWDDKIDLEPIQKAYDDGLQELPMQLQCLSMLVLYLSFASMFECDDCTGDDEPDWDIPTLLLLKAMEAAYTLGRNSVVNLETKMI